MGVAPALEAERLLFGVVDAFPGFAALYTADGTFVHANALARAASGRSPSDGTRPAWDLSFVAEWPALRAQLREVLARAAVGESVQFECLAPAPAGGTMDLEVSVRPIFDAGGAVTHVAVFGIDVGERNRTNRALEEGQAAYRRLHDESCVKDGAIDAAINGIAFSDLAGRITYVNRAFLGMWGYERDAELLGRSALELWADPEAASRALFGSLGANNGFCETVARRKDGSEFVALLSATVLRSDEGLPIRLMASFVDVTERVVAEHKMETLLREVHHRVKNNLQIISSFFHFLAKKVRDPADRAAIEEGRNRLLAMTLVHEKLYRSADLARVNLGDYVRAIAPAVAQSFERHQPVRLEVEAEDVDVPVEVAMPAGMILCELLTNAYKYAFSERCGHGRVTLHVNGGRVVLGVDDDGGGFPEGFDANGAKSFGWQLVRTLVLQLDGGFSATSERGAHVRVWFDLPVGRVIG